MTGSAPGRRPLGRRGAGRRTPARDLAQIAVFGALIAALGLPGTIHFGGNAVPITLQTLGVMLAGAILGARKGVLAVAAFEVLTLCGLPLLAGGRAGLGWFTTSASAGFLYGWLLGALVIGWLTTRLLPRYPLWLGVLATAVGGIGVIYLIGIPWQALRTHTSLWAATAADGAFLPGDAIKVVLTALIAKQVHRAYPGLIPVRRPLVPPAAGAHLTALVLGGRPGDPAITSGPRTVSYAELAALVDAVDPPPLTDLAGRSLIDAMTALFAAARAGRPVLSGLPEGPRPAPEALPPTVFLLAQTSGSSGAPRFVQRTAESWTASFPALTALTGVTPADTVGLTGPLSATLHLFAAVHTLWLGAHLTDRRPSAQVVHAVPSILATLLDTAPRLRTAIVAGAAIPAALERRLRDRGVTLIEYYGAAELSLVAGRRAPGPLRAFPGVEIDVRGELWVRSPYLADGYAATAGAAAGPLRRDADGYAASAGTAAGPLRRDADGHAATAGTAADPLRRDAEGFTTVGDRGTVAADGVLSVAGRGDAAITTAGATVLADDIEAALGGLPGVAAAVVVGLAHASLGQVVVAVIEPAAGADPAGVRAAARERLTGAERPRRWFFTDALPRTAGGKLARGDVRAQVDAALAGHGPLRPLP